MDAFLRACILFMPFLCYACSPAECVNQNRELQVYPFNSSEYNIALLRWINTSDPADVDYEFDQYVEESGIRAVIVNSRIDGQCAKARCQIEDSTTGIENIIETRGKGYYGAVLMGFKFRVAGESDPITLVFESVENVID